MSAQAGLEDRFLGGRPPYGCRLIDAGPHPTRRRPLTASACTNSSPTRTPPGWSGGSSPSTSPGAACSLSPRDSPATRPPPRPSMTGPATGTAPGKAGPGPPPAARCGVRVPALVRWLLGLGIAATLAANVVYGLGHGLVGAAVGAWPAVALVGSYEQLMVIIRGAQPPADPESETGCVPREDPLHEQAARVFADEVAAARVPSVRAIRASLHIGQPRAQRVRAYLTALAAP